MFLVDCGRIPHQSPIWIKTLSRPWACAPKHSSVAIGSVHDYCSARKDGARTDPDVVSVSGEYRF